ncbi:uncharacterized protein LOC116247038 [Nymphaea colorata]|nr:uncharacterized protein LOC116247038 [Nymphaea colorata]XP_049931721.1 uncharacterized protein LOC116247038 [Nymphaea colorata]
MASILVIVTVILLDVIALGLAAAAEQRRSHAQIVSDPTGSYTYCAYGSDIATGYGVGALLVLLGSQALVMASSSCFCCGKGLRPSGARACAMILFITCWITFIIAEACLLAGSVRNAYHTKYRANLNMGNLSCETIRKGVFAAGAAFTFFTCILSIFYYHFYSKAKGSLGSPAKDTGIGMRSYT